MGVGVVMFNFVSLLVSGDSIKHEGSKIPVALFTDHTSMTSTRPATGSTY